jgi:hypothetical protein
MLAATVKAVAVEAVAVFPSSMETTNGRLAGGYVNAVTRLTAGSPATQLAL